MPQVRAYVATEKSANVPAAVSNEISQVRSGVATDKPGDESMLAPGVVTQITRMQIFNQRRKPIITSQPVFKRAAVTRTLGKVVNSINSIIFIIITQLSKLIACLFIRLKEIIL